MDKKIDCFSKISFLEKHIKKLEEKEINCIKSLITIGQADRILKGLIDTEDSFLRLKDLIQKLIIIDKFYRKIGGIVGYHNTFIKLLEEKKSKRSFSKEVFIEPDLIDISNKNFTQENLVQENLVKKDFVQECVDMGIISLPKIAEIYPLGGSGDRLNLIDEKTKQSLPVAKFNFLGKTLLEHLILDLKAKEFFYYKTFKEKVTIPIIVMTSDAKNNHEHIVDIFEKNKNFGRPQDSIFFIKQISVPMIDEEGNWVMEDVLKLCLKPGGHGTLWQLMNDNKVFEWLYGKNIENIVIRQINNLLGSIDYNMFAFAGYGIKEKKAFGFATCPRFINEPEGMIVLKETQMDKEYEYVIKNIEYTDFEKYNIQESSIADSTYSIFPANTNILFANLEKVEKAFKESDFTSYVINMKSEYIEDNKKLKMGRLELLMQDIANNIVVTFPQKIKESQKNKLSTYITSNVREKTISVIKKAYEENKDITATPMSCYYDIQKNYRRMLSDLNIPKELSKEKFIKEGANLFCYINPLLGPLHSEIKKKIRKGEISNNSEIILDIADVDIENIYLEGSLQIYGTYENIDKASKCILKNVKVINEGIEKIKKNIYWEENKIKRKGFLKIVLYENSVFEANDVVFEEDQIIVVPQDHKITAFYENHEIRFEKKKL